MKTINLLKDKTNAGANFNLTNATSTGISFDRDFGDASAVHGKAIFARIIILFVFPLGLIGYENYHNLKLNQQLVELNKAIEKVNEDVLAFSPKVRDLRKFEEEERKLKQRMDTIIELSKERLSNVKALDALHDLVPERAWLTELKVKSGKFEITGLAVEPLIVSNLIGNFEESIFFTQVKLDFTEESRTKNGVLSRFKVSGLLGDF